MGFAFGLNCVSSFLKWTNSLPLSTVSVICIRFGMRSNALAEAMVIELAALSVSLAATK